MELSQRQGRLAAVVTLAFVAGVLLVRLSAFGIWDPWELTPADQARDVAEGESVELERPPMPTWLVAAGFDLFDVREWAGRFPMALAGLLAVALTYWLVARFAGRRAGVYAALVTGTTPLFLFNARQMLGEAPAFAAQAFVGLTAASAVFLPTTARDPPAKRRWIATGLWLAGLLIALPLAVWSQGALLGALPALLAVAVAAGLHGALGEPRRDPARCAAAWTVVLCAVVVTGFVAEAVMADRASYSAWLGGQPEGGDPPPFAAVLEDVFHAFAPWSALVLLALGRLLWPSRAARTEPQMEAAQQTEADDAVALFPQEGPLRIVLVLWIGFAYGALTLYMSRYGLAPWPAVAALGGAVALFLRDVERSGQAWWTAGVVTILFTVLIIRDYGLYPGGPIEGLAIENAKVPKEFNPEHIWGPLLGAFGLAALLGLGARPDSAHLDLRAPYRFVRTQWQRGLPFRVWLGLTAALLAFMLLFGVACFVLGTSLPVSTLVIRVGRMLTLVPLVLPLGVATVQGVLWGLGKLGQARLLPLLACGAAVGIYAAHGYLPSLSAHFSPREVYDTYNALADEGEPLGEYRVGSRAATYYAEGEIRELGGQGQLVQFLSEGDGRRWAVLPTDQLPAVDRAFRRRTGEHLFVPKATSARVMLAANRPVEGHPNRNFLEKFVQQKPPEDVENPVGARYEDKIELIGYDLDLPHGSYVGAGESFTVTWYWRCLERVPGSYKVFLHIDGQGLRLNGDHDPVDGKYPVRLWDEGDVIIDRQKLTVPANFRPGSYIMFIGFYSGDRRLQVEKGPADDVNRVRSGRLRIR